MADAHETISVAHDTVAHRFAATIDGHVAICDYHLDGDRMVFTHTFVPPALRGKGIAEQLVRVGLRWATEQNRRVVPACSYVAAFIGRHREFARLLG